MICGQCGTLNENAREECVRCRRPLHPAGMKGKIACDVHANREATTSCASCGTRLCSSCAVNANGIDYCENCAPANAVALDHEEDYERIPVIAPDKAERASFGLRLMSLLIDFVLVVAFPGALIAGCVFLVAHSAALFSPSSGGAVFYGFWFLYLLAVLAYGTVMIGMSGQTWGKQIAGVIVLDEDGFVLPWQKSALRAGAALLSALPLGLGFLWAIWDAKKETWHDKLSGTVAYRWEELT